MRLLIRCLWCRYIAPIFPKLFITSYNFVQEYCSQEIIVRAAETNFNMIRQVTTPVKPGTKGTGSVPAGSAMIPARNAMIPAKNAMIPARNAMIPARNAMVPARNAMIPVTTVAGRAAAGPVGPSAAAAKGRAGPALVGKAVHRKAATGPTVGSVSSGASRTAPVIPIRAAAGPTIGRVVPTQGPQMGMQRDTVLPGRAAARPTGGNMGPAKGHVGTTPGRVIHAPRVPPGHVQAQQVCAIKMFCAHNNNNNLQAFQLIVARYLLGVPKPYSCEPTCTNMRH